jgi:hypothetical protein
MTERAAMEREINGRCLMQKLLMASVSETERGRYAGLDEGVVV